MTSRTVHLGFEVGNGDHTSLTPPSFARRVEIPIRHMAVTGQTQESGKTTTLEALITRSGLAAIAFLTKRGESSFTGATRVPAYFHERADWQFVEAILESSMKQRMKFERAWIVKACKGAHTLADVQRNVAELQARSKRSMDQDLYMLLGEYLAKVVPLIRSLPKVDHVGIYGGKLTVMDLVDYPDELQMLVIASTLEWIHKHGGNTITVIPEAWKFIPQGKNTPVKIVAEKLAREGAGLRNYLWIDSQDMAAVDKMMLRACAVWLIGVQREANEIKRALSNMPAGLKKPKADQVATLQLGQFYACFGSEIRKTYVQPAWMDEKAGSAIAAGRLDVHSVTPPKSPTPRQWGDEFESLGNTPTPKQPAQAGTRRVESPAGSAARSHSPVREATPQTVAQEEEAMPDQETLAEIRSAIKDGDKDKALRLFNSIFASNGQPPQAEQSPRSYTPAESFDNEALYNAFKSRLIKEAPGIVVALTKSVPEIEVREVREKFQMDTTTREGRVAWLIADGYFDVSRVNAEVVNELAERGMPTSAPNVAHAFASLVEKGFLVSRDKGRYRAVAGMKVNIIRA
jgi:hypothetical protein